MSLFWFFLTNSFCLPTDLRAIFILHFQHVVAFLYSGIAS